MSILVNKNTKLVVQGITGRDGSFHTGKMKNTEPILLPVYRRAKVDKPYTIFLFSIRWKMP